MNETGDDGRRPDDTLIPKHGGFRLKLTGIAKGSQQELALDYEDFLRQHELPLWPATHPALVRFRARRCSTLQEFRLWVADEVRRAGDTGAHGRTPTDTDRHGHRPNVRARPCPSVSFSVPPAFPLAPRDILPATLAANGALSLLNISLYLLERQLEALAREFERNGGFTERLHRTRSARRGGPN